MSMCRSILIYAALLCTSVAALLSGCHTGVPAETADHLIGEEYPDAGKYRAGTFTYSADEVKAVEVYWRSGEVDIRESDGASLRVTESGELPEESAMHYFLDGDVLRIRFCADGVMSQSLKCSTSSGSVELGAELYCGEGESIHSEHC